MELPVIMACLCVLCVTLVVMVLVGRKHGRQLPPSPPWRVPILGHLHLLLLPLHHSLHKLSLRHGPFLLIWMGSSPAVVVSSPSWAKQFLHTHDRQFADRPPFEASKRIFYNNRSMVMVEHGPKWRDLRKLYTVHMFSSKRVEMFESHRLEEMTLSLKLIESYASAIYHNKEELGAAGLDMRKLVFNTVGNMMTRMLFGKRSFNASEAVEGRGESCRFEELVGETAVLLGTPFLGDLIPWLSWLDVQGLRKRMDTVAAEFDVFFEEVLAERMGSRRGGAGSHEEEEEGEEQTESDYLDILLRAYTDPDGRVDKDSIKCILLDFLTAGIETTTTAIEWTLAELLTNPSHLKKLQEELDSLNYIAAGGGAVAFNGNLGKSYPIIKDSQVPKLAYLHAIVKESLRLHPPFPIDMRQMCKEFDKGTQVGGYYLPRKTRVFINLWTMARDSTIWGSNANMFCPDRFLRDGDDLLDVRGQHFELLPFGTGRRGCPGMSMALAVLPFVVANLVLMFNWELPKGVTLDLSDEGAALTAPLAKPLVVVPSLRHVERS